MPNQYVGDGLLTIGISGLSRMRTELLRLAPLVVRASKVYSGLGADIVYGII